MRRKPIIMVSSTVYGIEELLERVYILLTTFKYEVWMSHKGTIPVFSNKTAFENSIEAVKNCDLFLGILTPGYGSGIDEDEGISILHKEFRTAIELNKPRWFLSHDHVTFVRSLLKDLEYLGNPIDRSNFTVKKGSRIFGDLRVIDMYDEAIKNSIHPLRERSGNWVQKYNSPDDALLFTVAQFSRYQEVEAFLQENLSDPNHVISHINRKGGSV